MSLELEQSATGHYGDSDEQTTGDASDGCGEGPAGETE